MNICDAAREAALKALFAWDREGEFADLAIKNVLSGSGLSARDAGFATRLFYRTVEMRIYLDYRLSRLSSMKLKKLHPAVLEILRLGACQILLMDSVPDSAAVNTSVALCHMRKMSRAAGMVNAILRKLCAEGDIPVEGEGADALSLRYSHPLWLVECYIHEFGPEDTEHILASNNAAPPVSVRVNTLKITPGGLRERLAADGIEWIQDPDISVCGTLPESGRIDDLSSFREGCFAVQDKACVASVLAADPKPGIRVLDLCAAPGGKSLCAAALMEGKGEITACDLYPHRVELIRKNAERMGADIVSAEIRDASVFDEALCGEFDLVICDVPCSGLGVIGKKPDLRYKNPDDFETLQELQHQIARNAVRYLKPGGRMVYSTCTLRSAENGEVVSTLLNEHPDLVRVPFRISERFASESGEITMLPHVHGTDGFYFSILEKRV
ncbi:MAG: 16S rRNA (cytosine(967)-C(5))-methyltransferase RsmB [Clostridia bacterium]|nr:16S rRNA (cytosine(967)-C(5))-methyltransferase RsmB [Clostridia bacterium]